MCCWVGVRQSGYAGLNVSTSGFGSGSGSHRLSRRTGYGCSDGSLRVLPPPTRTTARSWPTTGTQKGSHTFEPHTSIWDPAAEVGRMSLLTAHLPTGSVGLHEVLRLAVESFGVAPIRQDWDRVLQR